MRGLSYKQAEVRRGKDDEASVDSSKRYRRLETGGPLDINVYPTESAANRVAAEAFSLLNKYPGDIVDIAFPEEVTRKHTNHCSMRVLIELCGLRMI